MQTKKSVKSGNIRIRAATTPRFRHSLFRKSVTDVVKPEDKVQVRVKSIQANKVSLAMLSVDEERETAAVVVLLNFKEPRTGSSLSVSSMKLNLLSRMESRAYQTK